MYSQKERNQSNMDIQKSFDSSLKNSHISDIAIDFAEVSIDTIIENDIIKNIPIVKTFANIVQAGVNIQDRLFLKKIITLLQYINEIDEKTRIDMIGEIDSSDKYRIKVGEKLLYILDSCADYESAENIAKLFSAMMKKAITYDEYLEASSIVSRISTKTIGEFTYIYTPAPYGINIEDSGQFLSTGLLSARFEEVEVDVGPSRYDEGPGVDVSGGEIYTVVNPVGDTVFSIFASKTDIERVTKERIRRQQKQKVML